MATNSRSETPTERRSKRLQMPRRARELRVVFTLFGLLLILISLSMGNTELALKIIGLLVTFG